MTIVYQQNPSGFAGHGTAYRPSTGAYTTSVNAPVNTYVITRTITRTQEIVYHTYTIITRYYYPVISYITQYLMTWQTPQGMCQNGLCGVNPSLLIPTSGFTIKSSNSPNQWGHYTYIPAITAVFNYTGFGLQVIVAYKPVITGWSTGTSSSSYTTASTSTFTTYSQQVNTYTQYITQTTTTTPTGTPPTINTQFISYNGGGGNTPQPGSNATVYYPVYSTSLNLWTTAQKALLFTGASVEDAIGDALGYIGSGLSSAGTWLESTNNPIGQALGGFLQWFGNGLASIGYDLASAGKLVGQYAQWLGTSGSWESLQVSPGQSYNISPTYSTTYNGWGSHYLVGPSTSTQRHSQ
ncbi:hypothetical protein [Vulcanisaeta sp. JCM 16161]|uniref:hypothetical protein n=1 Tax=Vulcanisaeta sp. JCM 16161 TaxID=1295372 RepID=UPI0006D0690D|nr:hypothetical protein [Vulcanisaeta sp. JCM 16161]